MGCTRCVWAPESAIQSPRTEPGGQSASRARGSEILVLEAPGAGYRKFRMWVCAIGYSGQRDYHVTAGSEGSSPKSEL